MLAALASVIFAFLGAQIQSPHVEAATQQQEPIPNETSTSSDLLLGSVSLSELLPREEPDPADAQTFLSSLEAAVLAAEHSRELSRAAHNLFAAEAGPEGVLYLYALDPRTHAPVASIDASTRAVAASTYKLYVAYSMILAVEDGSASWSDPLLPGWSLGECLEVMITESDNYCPEEWLDVVGPETVQRQVGDLGLVATRIQWSHMETTAWDLARFLDLLWSGDIVSPANRDLLLGFMSEQEFREGIPAGVGTGVEVADKVGFLEELLHDAAIITGPDEPLILVILTADASWEAIGAVAELVYGDFTAASSQ